MNPNTQTDAALKELVDAATAWCRNHVLADECCPEHIRLLQAVAAYRRDR